MDFKELKIKPNAELRKLLGEQREILRGMRFKVANRSLKNVRDIRKIKVTIARILTILKKTKE